MEASAGLLKTWRVTGRESLAQQHILPMLLCTTQGPPTDQCRDLESFLVGPLNVRLLSDDFLSPGIVGQQNMNQVGDGSPAGGGDFPHWLFHSYKEGSVSQ